MNKTRATSLGLTSGLVVLMGVAMSVLLYFILTTVVDGINQANDDDEIWQQMERAPAPIWLTGLVFIFPGFLGLLAAFIQNKCMYVVCCIFSLISLLIMGAIFFFLGLALFVFIFAMSAVKENCYDDDIAGCQCRSKSSYDNTYSYKATPFNTCDILTTIIGLCIGLMVAVVLAWIFLLTVFILCVVYACRTPRGSSSRGTVFVPAQQPMLPPDQQGLPMYQK